ncbi:MAG: hypothetical protein HC828_07450 [Blastochloris sp.]|nr:hypothetical protein [Blastochloris sp.]
MISGVAGELVGAVKAMDSMLTPDEFTFEFGITFTANGNIVLASASTETTLHITMTYHHGKEKGT